MLDSTIAARTLMLPPGTEDSTGLGGGRRVSGQEPTPSRGEVMGGGPPVRWDSKPQSLAQVSHGDSLTNPNQRKT